MGLKFWVVIWYCCEIVVPKGNKDVPRINCLCIDLSARTGSFQEIKESNFSGARRATEWGREPKTQWVL